MRQSAPVRHLLAIFVVTFMAAIAVSCSGDAKLFNVIPEDADFVAEIDITRLTDKFDVRITDSGLTGPADVQTDLQSLPAQFTETLVRLNAAVDLSQVVIFGEMRGDIFAVASLTDASRLDDIFKDWDRQSAAGYRVYSDGSKYLVAADGNLWVVSNAHSSEAAASLVKETIREADKKSIAARKEIIRELSTDKIFSIVANVGPLAEEMLSYSHDFSDPRIAILFASVIPKLSGSWMSYTGDIDGNDFNFTARLFDAESGESISIPGLRKLDAKVLAYLPANAIFASAVGVENDIFAALISGASAYAGYLPGLSGVLEPLAKVDGTIAFGYGADYTAAGQKPENQAFLLAVQLKDGAAGELALQLGSFARTMGMQVSEMADRTTINNPIAASLPPVELTVRDKTLLITQGYTPAPSGNRFEKEFSGYISAGGLMIKSLAPFTSNQSELAVDAISTTRDGISRLDIRLSNLHGSLLYELLKAYKGASDNFCVSTPYGEESEVVMAEEEELDYWNED